VVSSEKRLKVPKMVIRSRNSKKDAQYIYGHKKKLTKKFIFLLSKYLPFNPSIIWDYNVSFDIYVRVCLHVTPFLELIFVNVQHM
jgi:hypothetical protein